MNCRIHKKQITLSFGLWPNVSLSEARRKREEAKDKNKTRHKSYRIKKRTISIKIKRHAH
tara:strand:+ start:284 stop:463 length:180 start_codon:yes stop_codon:yes gene_type:complete